MDRERLYSYSVDLEIAEPDEENRWFPSLLGRDILSQWLLRYEAPHNLLEAEVHAADEIILRGE